MTRDAIARVMTIVAASAVAVVGSPTGLRAQMPSPEKAITIATDQDLRQPMHVDFVQTWVKDVRAHGAGTMDAAAKDIAAWPAATAAVTLTDVASMARIAEWLEAQPAGTAVSYRRHSIVLDGDGGTGPDRVAIDALLGLDQGADRLAQLNRLIERGLMLHTDLAIEGFRLLRERSTAAVPPPASASSVGVRAGQTPAAPRAATVVDGEIRSFDDVSAQWTYARYLVDQIQSARSRQAPPHQWKDIRPDPSGDPFVRAWYRAVSAWQAQHAIWSLLQPLVEHGLVTFPDDRWLHFVNGAMHETFAAPPAQITARSMVLSGSPPQVKVTARELQIAEHEFARTLQIDPDFAEARLHLGQVIGQAGRHADAVGELAPLPARFADAALAYDAWLFLGRERAAAGDAAGARQAFDAAATLYPQAQSPKLGVSVLTRDAGDIDAAALPVLSLLRGPVPDAAHEDPFWTYDNSYVRDADALIDALRHAAGTEARR